MTPATAPTEIPASVHLDAQRSDIDQRCMCSLCRNDTRATHAVRALCGRCREPLRVLNRMGDAPLAYSTCPNCGRQAALFYEAPSETDMAAFEDDEYETVREA